MKHQNTVVKKMLKKNSNWAETPNTDGKIAIHAAAQVKDIHPDIIRLLTSKAGIVDTQDNDGFTALHTAAQEGHLETIKLLLACNAKLVSKSKTEKTVLQMATEHNRFEVVEYLCSLLDFDQTHLTDALLIAQYKKNQRLVNLLDDVIKSRFRINDTINHNQERLFAIKVDSGNAESVALYLKSGINSNLIITLDDKINTTTPLFLAAQKGHIEIVKLLLANGAEPDKANSKGFTPLYIAIENKHLSVAEALLKTDKIDINRKLITKPNAPELGENFFKKMEETSIMLNNVAQNLHSQQGIYETYLLTAACHTNNLSLVELLLTAKADPNIATYDMSLLCQLITKEISVEVVRLLLQHKVNIDTPAFCGLSAIQYAVLIENQSAIKILFEHPDAKAIFTQERKDKLLLFAYSITSKEAARTLIELGAEANLKLYDFTNKTIADWLNIPIEPHSDNSQKIPQPINDNLQIITDKPEALPVEEVKAEAPSIIPVPQKTQSVLPNSNNYLDTSPAMSMSARKYLIEEMGFSEKSINLIISVNKQKKKQAKAKSGLFSEKYKVPDAPTFSWCQNLIKSKLDCIQIIRGGVNAYYIFPEIHVSKQLAEKNGNATLYDEFKKVDAKFDDLHIKKLTGSGLNATINNQVLTAAHELKIAASEARFLVFSIISDDKKATLYFPAIFCPNGLHELKDLKSLNDAKNIITIDWQAEIDAHKIPEEPYKTISSNRK